MSLSNAAATDRMQNTQQWLLPKLPSRMATGSISIMSSCHCNVSAGLSLPPCTCRHSGSWCPRETARIAARQWQACTTSTSSCAGFCAEASGSLDRLPLNRAVSQQSSDSQLPHSFLKDCDRLLVMHLQSKADVAKH